ncbi:MAG TPA: AzlD domain-containing protein [Gaiellaceae bacterium]|jgi:branched-subunit amino acid transport protein|nr:AzlD domain-containing protein [Gaiellaceae bacterium]
MTEFWIVVGAVGAATVLFKAAGPVLLGRRPLPPRGQSVVDLLAPVMLTALVVTQTFGGDGEVTVDARLPGVAAAALAIWRRVPIIVAMLIAGVVTGLVRAVA